MIEILVVEDHTIVRTGLVNLIDAQEDMEVVAETGLGREALTLARDLKPDVVLLDLDLPDMEGIDVTDSLSGTDPEIKILILTMYKSEDIAASVLRAGARGYLVKSSGLDELTKAIRTIAEGRPYIAESIRDKLLMQQLSPGRNGENPVAVLSDRERQVLLGLADGKNMPAIAEKLGISTSTVKTYKQRINEKLGLDNISDYVKFCIRHDLIQKY